MMNLNDSRAQFLIQRHDGMKTTRGTWESHWQECAELAVPVQADFVSKRSDGERRTQKIFDGTAMLALERFSAALQSMLTPANRQWHKIQPPVELRNNTDVMRYCEQVTEILFRVRRSPIANFANNFQEVYLSLGCFGTGPLFIDDELGRGIRYQSIHLGEVYLMESASGLVDWVHREYELTVHQAIQAFGSALPEVIRGLADKEPQRNFTFLHCVKPNDERNPRLRNYRGMPMSSYHVSLEGKAIVREGGYRTMPYAVSRYIKSSREVYGRSPMMTALADAKTLQEQEKTLLRAGQRAVDPPLLMHGDGVMGFQIGPNKLNPSTVNEQGQPLVVPLQTGGNIPLGIEMTDQKRKFINDVFLVTLFQILIESPEMTATEVLQRAREKGELLAPTVGRQESELLGPTIVREIDILSAAGQLPEMPDALLDYGGEYAIEYDGPLSRLVQAEAASGILRTFEAFAPLLQVDPKVMRRINTDEAAKVLARANGVPESCIYSDDELAAMEAEQAQQEAVANGVAAAVPASQAALNIAKAQQIAEAPVAPR